MTAAILDFRPAAKPETTAPAKATTDLVRLLALDRIPAGPHRLVCHWRRDSDGRLSAIWEPDIFSVPQR